MEYPNIVCTSLLGGGTMNVGTHTVYAMKTPSNAQGGGCTVIDAAVTSGSAIGAGSIPMFDLVYANSGGTILGTIGNSSTAAFTAGTPKAITVTETFVDAGYYIGWKVKGTAVSADKTFVSATFTYVPGY